MRIASTPRCSTIVRLAASDTAIRARTFSIEGCNAPCAAVRIFERGLDVWNVATMGPSASMHVSRLTLGAVGSCTCNTSKSFSRNHLRTRAADTGPISSLATEPL